MGVVELKSATISKLQEEVDIATKTKVDAEATVNAFTDKANMFSEILGDTQRDRLTAEKNYELAVKASQSSSALSLAALKSADNAAQTNKGAREMLQLAQRVVDRLLDAALEVSNLSRFIQARKAANPYISSEMVAEAAQSEADAAAAVAAAIQCLTATSAAFRFSQQAQFSTNLTEVESMRFDYLVDGSIPPEVKRAMDISQQANNNASLLAVLRDSLKSARAKESEAQYALDIVNARLAQANRELNKTTTDLSVKIQALAAAKATVAIAV